MELIGTSLQDLRYAWRNLWRSPGFTAVAALTLTIGIGANTAIFSVIDSVLLRPLPFRDPAQLVRLYETEAAPGNYPFAPPDFLDWKTQNRTFQDMALFGWSGDMNLSGEARPDHVSAVPTEGNFFALLGAQPLLGRTWMPGEDQPGKDQVAILSYGLWQEHFAGDPKMLGRTILLNSKKYTIVGVMPPNFRFPFQTQMWIPLDMDGKSLGHRGSHWANAIGRLKPGVSLERARADLKLISGRLEKAYPDSNDKVGSAAVGLHDDLVGDSRGSLIMMLAAVGLVLLIACANVANLLLSRAVSRQKEMAVRSALGAVRGRLLRQLLTESLLLSGLGGALGCAVAWILIKLASHAKNLALPQFNAIQLNGTVLAFALALAAITGVLFGLIPAMRTSRPDLHEELKGGAGSLVTASKRRRLTSDVLVCGEMALSLVLLVSAGLLLKDFARLRSLDIGVRTEGVFTAGMTLPDAQYKKEAQQRQFAQAMLEKTAAIGGVDAAAITSHLPLEGGSNYFVKLRGQTTHMSNLLVEYHTITPDYFHALGIRLLKGRGFTPADLQRAADLDKHYDRLPEGDYNLPKEESNAMIYPVVINETMAHDFWPNQNPLGQLFSQGSDNGPWKQVIGVVNDVRQWGLTHKPVPEAYDAFTGRGWLFVVLHTPRQPLSLATEVRRALAQVDPQLSLFSVRTMDQVIGENAQGQQFLSLLVGAFAALAVLLAAVGIYGVLSYLVTERTREIGIRMSLGASRRRVLSQVVLDGMRLAVIGFAVGLAGAAAAGRVLASLLHEVKPGDPAVFAATAGFLLLVAFGACYLPARRAARLDPMSALRYE
jgi:putative ABC transport system permease protein